MSGQEGKLAGLDGAIGGEESGGGCRQGILWRGWKCPLGKRRLGMMHLETGWMGRGQMLMQDQRQQKEGSNRTTT